jgi:hypothetical protein
MREKGCEPSTARNLLAGLPDTFDAWKATRTPMTVIRDDGSVISEPDHWDSAEQFVATIRAMAKSFTLDHSTGQKTRLVGGWHGPAARPRRPTRSA